MLANGRQCMPTSAVDLPPFDLSRREVVEVEAEAKVEGVESARGMG